MEDDLATKTKAKESKHAEEEDDEEEEDEEEEDEEEEDEEEDEDDDEEGESYPWFACIATEPAYTTGSGGAGAPYYPAMRWKDKQQLKVVFTKPIPSWRRKIYPYDFISPADILKWANVWSSEELGLKGIVPEFVLENENDSNGDIRVTFKTQTGSWSRIGSDAESYQGSVTMILNLADSPNIDSDIDDYRQFTVIHEFGHALGLGHEHQTSVLRGALKKEETIVYLEGLLKSKVKAKKKFQADYSPAAQESKELGTLEEWPEFDPWSIMCYPIPADLFTDDFKAKFSTDEKAREKFERLTTQSYEKRKTLSKIDIATIKELYCGGQVVTKKINIKVQNKSSNTLCVSCPSLDKGKWTTSLPSLIQSNEDAQGTIEDVSSIKGSPVMTISARGHEGEVKFSFQCDQKYNFGLDSGIDGLQAFESIQHLSSNFFHYTLIIRDAN